MTFMEVIGFIAVGFFALLGLALAIPAMWEYIVVQYLVLKGKIKKEAEVREENAIAKAELKRAHLAKKRAAGDIIAHKKLDAKLDQDIAKTDEKLGLAHSPAAQVVEEKPHRKQKEVVHEEVVHEEPADEEPVYEEHKHEPEPEQVHDEPQEEEPTPEDDTNF